MKEKIEKILCIIVLTPIIGSALWQFAVMALYGILTGQLW